MFKFFIVLFVTSFAILGMLEVVYRAVRDNPRSAFEVSDLQVKVVSSQLVLVGLMVVAGVIESIVVQ